MSIWTFTIKEWNDLPQVILTADVDWDPTIIDCELEDGEEWFDTMQDLPEFDPDPLCDEIGDYRHIQNVANTIVNSNLINNCIIKDYNDVLQLYNQNVIPKQD